VAGNKVSITQLLSGVIIAIRPALAAGKRECRASRALGGEVGVASSRRFYGWEVRVRGGCDDILSAVRVGELGDGAAQDQS